MGETLFRKSVFNVKSEALVQRVAPQQVGLPLLRFAHRVYFYMQPRRGAGRGPAPSAPSLLSTAAIGSLLALALIACLLRGLYRLRAARRATSAADSSRTRTHSRALLPCSNLVFGDVGAHGDARDVMGGDGGGLQRGQAPPKRWVDRRGQCRSDRCISSRRHVSSSLTSGSHPVPTCFTT